MKNISLFIVFIILNTNLIYLAGQQALFYEAPIELYKSAKTNFIEKNYVLSQKKYELFLEQIAHHELNYELCLLKIDAEYGKVLCAIRTNAPNTEYLLTTFIDENEPNHYTKRAYYYLAQLYFNNKRYEDANKIFKDIDISSLSASEQQTYAFQYGYSLFLKKDNDNAHKQFSKISTSMNPYYYDANYYNGMIAYFKKDYNSAINNFKILEDHQRYGKPIPFYITSMYFLQDKNEELLHYANKALEKTNIDNRKEITQIIGQTYFNQKKFAEALPHLYSYVRQSDKVRKEDLYQLGYTQYQLEKYNEAIDNFTQLNTLSDTIGQNAMYHLADCYLKINEKAKARNAFELVQKPSVYDAVIKEVSAFNYAKLSYELGLNSIATQSFKSFIETYPISPYNAEAKKLLSQLLEISQNYTEALDILESISNKSPEIQTIYQRVAYFKGVELYNDRKFDDALNYFNKSLQYPLNANYNSLAYYWKGDIYFKQHQYPLAISTNQIAINSLGGNLISDKVSAGSAYYTMGYSDFKQKNYTQALQHFNNCINYFEKINLANSPISSRIYADAILRSGDCSFMNKDYSAANRQYKRVITSNLQGNDYAFYQQGILAGLMGNMNDKIEIMTGLVKAYPDSYYADDALYQKAIAQVSIQQYNDAIETHKLLINKYEYSSYVPKSLVNLGLIYYNLNQPEKSIEFYDLVLRNYPNSPEAQEAILGSKDVFIAKGDAEGYVSFLKKYTNVNISTNTRDSITYQIAENYYLKPDCDNAISSFNKYLSNYPNGVFKTNAHYYRADCLYSQQKYADAGKDYDLIINQPRNNFTDASYNKAAKIALYINKDYNKAYLYFRKVYENASQKDLAIEALRGLVESSYYLKKEAELTEYSSKLIKNPNVSSEDITEINFYKGKLNLENGKFDVALDHFEEVANKNTSEKGAAARYYIAEIYFKKEMYEKCKEACLRTNKETSSYEYWTAKAFILIADIYTRKNEIFQAKATLKSILENYTVKDEVRKEAQDKYDKLVRNEAAKTKLENKKTNPNELELDNK